MPPKQCPFHIKAANSGKNQNNLPLHVMAYLYHW